MHNPMSPRYPAMSNVDPDEVAQAQKTLAYSSATDSANEATKNVKAAGSVMQPQMHASAQQAHMTAALHAHMSGDAEGCKGHMDQAATHYQAQ